MSSNIQMIITEVPPPTVTKRIKKTVVEPIVVSAASEVIDIKKTKVSKKPKDIIESNNASDVGDVRDARAYTNASDTPDASNFGDVGETTNFVDKALDVSESIVKKKRVAKPKPVQVDKSKYQREATNTVVYTLENADKTNFDQIETVLRVIREAHNFLHCSENIVGADAMNEILNLLFIVVNQPIFTDKPAPNCIDIYNLIYYDVITHDSDIENTLKCFKDLNYMTHKNIPLKLLRSEEHGDIIKFMGSVLRAHPITRQIFTDENFMRAKKATTIIGLVKILNKIDMTFFRQCEDIIGAIYELFITEYSGDSKAVGQFFTPRSQIILAYKYHRKDIKNLIKSIPIDQTINVGDFSLGTGGWLVLFNSIYGVKHGERINYFGMDVVPKTFQLAMMNLLTTTNKIPDGLKLGDSLSYVNNDKMHIIATNPPFTSGNMKIKDIETNFNSNSKGTNIQFSDIYKLKSSNMSVLFTELNLYKLEDGGICITVLPNGELISGRGYIKFRKYLLEQTQILSIIEFPGGIYSHTAIKTIVIVFRKNKTGSTEPIKMIRSNDKCTELIQIASISQSEMNANHKLSFDVADYLIDVSKHNCGNSSIMQKLGDVCNFQNGSCLTKKNIIPGIYPVIGGGQQPMGYHTNYNMDENTILCSLSGAYAGYLSRYPSKVWASDCFGIIPTVKINYNYIYIILKLMQSAIYKYQRGAAQPHVYASDLAELEIPVPSLEIQQQIVDYCDACNESIKSLEADILQKKQDSENFLNQVLKQYCAVSNSEKTTSLEK